MTSTYDHRVIQGAESGRLPAPDRAAAAGRGRLLRVGRRATWASTPASSPPPTRPRPRRRRWRAVGCRGADAPSSRPSPTRSSCRRSRPRPRCSRPTAPTATSPRGSTRSAREPKGDPALQPENLNLTPELMARIPASILRIGVEGETLLEALPRMREAYCGTIAYQIEHLSSHQQRMWLREMVETGAHRQPLDREEKRAPAAAPDRGLRVRALHREGLPRPEDVLDRGPRRRSCRCSTSSSTLAHRSRRRGGRDRHGPPRPAQRPRPQPRPLGRVDPGRVRGREGDRRGQGGRRDPPPAAPATSSTTTAHEGVYETTRRRGDRGPPLPEPQPPRVRRPGRRPARARASQTEPRRARRSSTTRTAAVPVLLHGDAAFPGQGVVAETLNLQSLMGYSTGGTIHIIQNNQVGFTTDPEEGRSTPYAADMAKGFNVPDHPRQRRRRRGLRRRRSAWRWPTASAGAATSSST